MDILRIVAIWSGFFGAPGYSNFHFTTDAGFWDGGIIGDEAQIAADSAAERIGSALTQLSTVLPSGVTIQTESEADVLNSDTGELIGNIEVPGYMATGSGSGGGYSAASGGVINWRTNDYRFGRRIRGRTFIVPLSGSAYEDDGTLTSSALSTLRGFGSDIIAGGGDPEFGVWSRPRDGSGGVFATAVSSQVPDMAAVLRSRRD